MRNGALIALIAALLAGCASPPVDRSAPTFNSSRYELDLVACQGGHIAYATAKGIGVAVAGSALGALHGVYYGAIGRDTREGAIVGAVVGGVVGFGIGAGAALNKHNEEVGGCLRDRGYFIEPAQAFEALREVRS